MGINSHSLTATIWLANIPFSAWTPAVQTAFVAGLNQDVQPAINNVRSRPARRPRAAPPAEGAPPAGADLRHGH